MAVTTTRQTETRVAEQQQQQRSVRPEVMAAFEQSVARNSELLRLLAK